MDDFPTIVIKLSELSEETIDLLVGKRAYKTISTPDGDISLSIVDGGVDQYGQGRWIAYLRRSDWIVAMDDHMTYRYADVDKAMSWLLHSLDMWKIGRSITPFPEEWRPVLDVLDVLLADFDSVECVSCGKKFPDIESSWGLCPVCAKDDNNWKS